MKTGIGTNTFRAFRNRNYTLYFVGRSVSQFGTWMQRTGVVWLIYIMTHSTFMLGLTIFAEQFPSFLLSLLGGVASDRYDRYKLLLITQTASTIQAVLLAMLTFGHHYTVWEILSLSVVLGVINAFDVPARQALVHEVVSDKADLANALALNSSMASLATLLGPALAGIILEKFGADICFLSNAVSFVAVIISLLLMKLPEYHPPPVKKKVLSEMAEGFAYLKRTPAIGMIILMLTLVSLLVLPYNTLLPVFAKMIFKGDAATFGYINSFIGLGAVAGAVFLASLKEGTDLKFVLLVSTVLLGIGLLFFSHISYFPLAMLFAALCGFGGVAQFTICNTIVQIEATPSMRGRAISFLLTAIFGMLPLGSLLIGAISQKTGAPDALLCEGLIALIIAAVFSKFLRKDRLTNKSMEQLAEAEEMAMEKI